MLDRLLGLSPSARCRGFEPSHLSIMLAGWFMRDFCSNVLVLRCCEQQRASRGPGQPSSAVVIRTDYDPWRSSIFDEGGWFSHVTVGLTTHGIAWSRCITMHGMRHWFGCAIRGGKDRRRRARFQHPGSYAIPHIVAEWQGPCCRLQFRSLWSIYRSLVQVATDAVRLCRSAPFGPAIEFHRPDNTFSKPPQLS
jgi:hypothetical protein